MSEESVRGELSSLDGTLQKQSGERVVYDGRENKSVKMSLTARWDYTHPWIDKIKGYAKVELVKEETENEKRTSEKKKYSIPLKSSEVWDMP